MNEPVIDNLFSVAAPRPDVSLAVGSRRTDDNGEFDVHLRQAGIPGSDPSPQPWWRSPSDRRGSDQGPPDTNRQTTSQPPERASEPATEPSPPAESASVEESAPVAKAADTPFEHGADQTATEGGVTAAAEQVSVKNAPDKSATDKPSTSELPRGAKNTAERPEKAKPDTAAVKSNISATATTPTTAAAVKGTLATPQGSPTSAQLAVRPVDTQTSAKDRHEKSSDADTTTKPTKPEAAIQHAEQATPTTPLAAVAAVPTNEAASASADSSEAPTDPRRNKGTAEHGVPAQKQPTRSATQSGQSPTKQSAAAQTTATETRTGDASTESAAATPSAKPARKADAKQQDSASADDTSTAEPVRQVAQVRNQPTPNVAAITASNNVEQATATDSAAEAGARIAKTSAAPKSATLAAFGRLDRDGLLTARGPRQAGDTSDAPRVDPARFVGRVARAIETAQDRGGTVNLRLSPPELGSLRLQLEVKQGVMNAKIETDTAAARQALLDNLPSLRERLAEQNVRIERFDVDVRRDGHSDQASPGPQQRQFQQHGQYYQAPSTRPAAAPAGNAEAAAEPLPAIRTITDTTINLVA